MNLRLANRTRNNKLRKIHGLCNQMSLAERLEVVAHSRDALSVVGYFLGTRIALQIDHAEVGHSRKNLTKAHISLLLCDYCTACCNLQVHLRQRVRIPDLVVLDVQCGNRRIYQMHHVIDTWSTKPCLVHLSPCTASETNLVLLDGEGVQGS